LRENVVEIWEHVLDADRRLDLADPEVARRWFASRAWPVPSPESAWWTTAARQRWSINLLALRGLARRLKKWRPGGRARPGAEAPPELRAAFDSQDDNTLAHYLGLLQLAVERLPGGKPLDARTFRTGLVPTLELSKGGGRKLVPAGELPATLWCNDLDVFWQVVFHGLACGGTPAVCAECGRPLGVDGTGKTAKGRSVRARTCGPCTWKKWYADRSPEQKRTRHRRDQAVKSKRRSKRPP
jgi:hypothetical protein